MPIAKAVEVEEGVVRQQLFEVKAKGPHYTTPSRYYAKDPRPKEICHLSVDEVAVYFWQTGLRHADMLERSSYQTDCRVHTFVPPAMKQRDEQHSSVAAF